ncbi:MAG: hypothetical protein CME62_13910 [Halobacteriovoraceae bacterium]|nr:hypothetical protein [Halobacteriovoraceae bacterium]
MISWKQKACNMRKGYIMKISLIATISMLTISAFAQTGPRGMNGMRDQIKLQVNQQYQGQSTIALKRLLKQQRPGLDVQAMDLQAVLLTAKSKAGNAQAVLQVGQRTSYPKTVMGNPRAFNRPGPRTFHTIRLQNPKLGDKGVWQIDMRGNIKVKDVTLIVKQAQIVQNVVINLPARNIMQGHSKLALKRMIQQQNPRMNLNGADLVKVTLMAKSKMGRAQATLVTGYNSSYPATIPGLPRTFNSNGPRTFFPVTLIPSRYANDMGKWQVEINGQVKITQVIITLKQKGLAPIPRRGGRTLPYPRGRRGTRRGGRI